MLAQLFEPVPLHHNHNLLPSVARPAAILHGFDSLRMDVHFDVTTSGVLLKHFSVLFGRLGPVLLLIEFVLDLLQYLLVQIYFLFH